MRVNPTPTLPNGHDLCLFLPSEAASAQFAKICGQYLTSGDTVLLSGAVGTGKSHFARALIRSKLGENLDVPSPTFTLVQTYEGAGLEIWHADLYRLTHMGELAELGLDQAIGLALCLIEWPDRLGDILAPNAVSITFSYEDDGRKLAISGASPALAAALNSQFKI